MYTTITVSRKTKDLLEKLKTKLEARLRRKLTWDEFLEKLALMVYPGSILELSDEEAETIARMVVEGRESWKRSA